MTINEIIEHENIRSDRYAMAAISYIFKAFGDPIRSKEYWPWGKDVQYKWYPSRGTNIDITEAELLLERARQKFEEETNSTSEYTKLTVDTTMDYNKEIKQLQKRLNKFTRNLSTVTKSNNAIKNISEETSSKISE